MKIERTHDMALVVRIMSHPSIFPHIAEDGTDRPEPVDHPGFYWMLATDGGEPAGLFLVHARGAVCYEMHTMILPAFRGALASAAAQALLAWAFTELCCQKVVTSVPDYNRAALRFALANGMRQEGVNRASFLRRGQLIDQINLGITKKEWIPCQQQSQQ
ncbi:GNAT family N-acetyltransferase [Massilia sp. NEAU-DD11]|uniref:GNAT family N-acetyltransferase n=1 Tax=Massilia cellulosiltytica TaxID=2683234 RepID=A0A7X3G6E0_9BURK|nr:GNAT family protein [Telluria cellulosilytica]MVW64521.1 GNAT family N-acetyltransferase [Telluria cellulosilytica]